MVNGMGLIWYILMLIGIGVVSGIAFGVFVVSSLFIPFMASKPNMSKVREKLDDNADPKRKKVLIAYNTKNGSTVEVGLKMQEILQRAGYAADVRYIPYMMDDDISGYDAYIVGGAIYWSNFMQETQEFLAKNLEIFKQKPTALFMMCVKMCNSHATKLQGDEAKWRKLSLEYLEPMFERIQGLEPSVIDIGTFAGNFHYKTMNLSELTMMGLHLNRTGLKTGDYVDFDKVSAWTEKLAKNLNLA